MPIENCNHYIEDILEIYLRMPIENCAYLRCIPDGSMQTNIFCDEDQMETLVMKRYIFFGLPPAGLTTDRQVN